MILAKLAGGFGLFRGVLPNESGKSRVSSAGRIPMPKAATNGDPLHYVAIAGRKEADIPAEVVEQVEQVA